MLSLTQSSAFIIGPVAKVLGYIMRFIYLLLDKVGIANIGLCIILFTIIIYLLMLPLTFKQQKFSRMSAIMNPEIKAIQNKYKNKTDQESMMKQNEEIQAVYQKYGVSMSGGCLQMLIQFPILFALYQVIMRIPAYVVELKDKYEVVVTAVKNNKAVQKTFIEFAEQSANMDVSFGKKGTSVNHLIDAMCKFSTEQLEALKNALGGADVAASVDKIVDVNHFILNDFSLVDSPSSIISRAMDGGIHGGTEVGLIVIALAIPILAGLTQFLNTKLMPQTNTNDDQGSMAASMKTMNMVMPIMSVVFCFSFASGIGLYLVMGSVVRSIQQIIINKKFENIDVDKMIEKNMEKVNEKRQKMGLPPQKISTAAKQNTRNIEVSEADKEARKKSTREQVKASSEYYSNTSTAKQGSLKSKANMVKQYNEKNNKK